MVSLVIRPPSSVVRAVALATILPAPIAEAVALDTSYLAHQTGDLATRWGEGIFYKFDHILHANKHLKMGKHFLKNILLQNKRSSRYTKNLKTLFTRVELACLY